ncbi:hypothetical protein Tco_0316401 [Tanacetum coccineum]
MTRSYNESKTSHAVAANLSKLELKKILIDKMESNKSIHRSDEQKNLYKALVDAYESDKLILDTYGDTISFKRRRDDEDNDEKPSAGSNRGSKSHHKSADKSTQVEEPMHTVEDLEEPAHQEFVTGDTEDKPDEETSQHPDWFQKLAKPPTPDRDWNKTLPAAHRPVQPWLITLAQKEDTLGPTFELLKGSCKSLVELEYFFEEVYKVTTDQLDWNNPEECGVKCWLATINMLSRESHIEDKNDNNSMDLLLTGNLLEMVLYKLYKFKEGDFNRLRIQDIEDMLLLLVQGKLTNLTVEERLVFNVSLRMFTRSVVIQRRVEDLQLAYSNPRGFIYQNKDKKNIFIRIDELHKFSDGTLNDVRTALDDSLKGIRIKYLPQTIWRQTDRDKAGDMIQAINKQLKTRRIMRSLEKFVSGRPYDGDFRLLQRTI